MRRSNKFQLLKMLAVGAAILMLVVSVATWLDQPYNVEIAELPHEVRTTLKEVHSPPEVPTKRRGPPPQVLIQNKYAGIMLKKFTYYKDNMNKQVMLYQMSDQEKADYAKEHFNVSQHKNHAVHNAHEPSKKRRRPAKIQQNHDSNEGGEIVDDEDNEDQPNQHAKHYDEESEGEREDYDDDEEAAQKLAELHPKKVQRKKANQKKGVKNPVNQANKYVKPPAGRKGVPIKKQGLPSKKAPKSDHLNETNVKKEKENENDDADHLEENEDEDEEVKEVNENESNTVPKSKDPRKAPPHKEEAEVPQPEIQRPVPKKVVEIVEDQPKNYKIEPRIDKSQTNKKKRKISPENK